MIDHWKRDIQHLDGNLDMNNIRLSYKDCTISIAHHSMGSISSVKEVAILYPDDSKPIGIVDTFGDNVESIQEAIAKAKAIVLDYTNEVRTTTPITKRYERT
jgi:hypothetical protein